MSERRMFAKTIIDSDAFLDMPLSTQALYFHLSMRADDEGFINNPKKIQRMVGASDDDLKVLVAKNFVIPFESGIVVIKHWRIHNYISGDRLHETNYTEEKSLLQIKDNGAYTLVSTDCLSSGGQVSDNLATEVNIGKVNIGKDNIYNTAEKSKRFVPPTIEEVRAYCQERNNTVDPETFINFYESKGWFVGKTKMKDWKASVRTWESKRKSESKSSFSQEKGYQNASNPDFLKMLEEESKR